MNYAARLVLEASTGTLGADAKTLADEWCKVAEENARLRAVVSEVHSWIVCAVIATPEDMAQNFDRICAITTPEQKQ